jgi:hypothetical protein
MSNKTPLLEVALTHRTNKIVGNFMLDTGWPYSSIMDSCAASLGLIPLPSSVAAENAERGTQPEPESVLVPHFQCGDLDLGAVSLVVREAKRFRSLIPEPIDGIIGADLLVSLSVFFDFPQQTITFYRADKKADQILKHLALEPVRPLPLVMMESDPLIPVRVNKTVETMMLVDTGGARTAVSLEIARQLQLTSVKTNATFETFFGISPIHLSYISSLEIRDMTLNEFPICFHEEGYLSTISILSMDIMS